MVTAGMPAPTIAVPGTIPVAVAALTLTIATASVPRQAAADGIPPAPGLVASPPVSAILVVVASPVAVVAIVAVVPGRDALGTVTSLTLAIHETPAPAMLLRERACASAGPVRSSTISRWIMARRCRPRRPRSGMPGTAAGPGSVTHRTRGTKAGLSAHAQTHSALVYVLALHPSSM
jgi:hypothetical protein